MKILIIENIWLGKASYGMFDKLMLTGFSILPTLYARQIAAITPDHHEVTVHNERFGPVRFSKDYDLVHITYTTSTACRAYDIADQFRKLQIPVVLSGMHASAVPKEAQQHADSILLGRGELSWLQLLSDFEQGTLQPVYPPVFYTDDIRVPPTEVQLPGFVITGAVEATRGCPYQCTFCPEAALSSGHQFYARPVEEVIEELQRLPQKTVMFYDASLTINPSYTKELFTEMQGRGKHFFCNGNADVLAEDIELVELSKKAGCVSWLVGFESFSTETLKTVGKNTNQVEQYTTVVRNLHDQKMAVVGCFMFGFDTDTAPVFKNTFQMIKDLAIDIADFTILTPFPGTPLYEQLQKEKRILTQDWSRYNLRSAVFQPKQMSPETLEQGVRYLYASFYNTSYSLHRIIRSIRLGIYPFFMVLARNAVANMSRRALLASTVNDEKN